MSNSKETSICQNCLKPILSANFELHTSFCLRNFFRCNVCNNLIEMKEKSNHSTTCQSQEKILCGFCKESFPTLEINSHSLNCLKKPCFCKFCSNIYMLEEMKNHEEICGKLTFVCQYCCNSIMLKNFKEHNETCQKDNKDSFVKNKVFTEIQKEIFKHKKNIQPSNLNEYKINNEKEENFNKYNNPSKNDYSQGFNQNSRNIISAETEENFNKYNNPSKNGYSLGFNQNSRNIISAETEENSRKYILKDTENRQIKQNIDKNSIYKPITEKNIEKKTFNPFMIEKNSNKKELLPSMKNYLDNSTIKPEQKSSNILKYIPEPKNISSIIKENNEFNTKYQSSMIKHDFLDKKSNINVNSIIKKNIPQSEIDYKTQKELDELIALNYYQEDMDLHSRLDEETAKKIQYEQEQGITESTIKNIQRNEMENQLAFDEYLAHEYLEQEEKNRENADLLIAKTLAEEGQSRIREPNIPYQPEENIDMNDEDLKQIIERSKYEK